MPRENGGCHRIWGDPALRFGRNRVVQQDRNDRHGPSSLLPDARPGGSVWPARIPHSSAPTVLTAASTAMSSDVESLRTTVIATLTTIARDTLSAIVNTQRSTASSAISADSAKPGPVSTK